jgi:hypothetical protein
VCRDDAACATRHLANIIWFVSGATIRQFAEGASDDSAPPVGGN